MRGSTSVGYDQFETSPEAIEQELRPAVCERRLTDRLKTNYSIDVTMETPSDLEGLVTGNLLSHYNIMAPYVIFGLTVVFRLRTSIY